MVDPNPAADSTPKRSPLVGPKDLASSHHTLESDRSNQIYVTVHNTSPSSHSSTSGESLSNRTKIVVAAISLISAVTVAWLRFGAGDFRENDREVLAAQT